MSSNTVYCAYCADPISRFSDRFQCNTCQVQTCSTCYQGGSRSCPTCLQPLQTPQAASAGSNKASGAPAPTAIPMPTAVPTPTATPKPTAIPTPTAMPTPTPTPAGSQGSPSTWTGSSSSQSVPIETFVEDHTKWQKKAWWTDPNFGPRMAALGTLLVLIAAGLSIYAAKHH